ncbi:MAG: bifunctional folylpolyglutamate synthase/dihydrofolate synthase [Eubacteriales bacterium]|nr:bifunctional folylpolyglutamate synthase/dihydrofolate synthase [Eubacteriales bacterium]MDD4583262.1 bifunctional folylpolyglutamate synthase/dihydrofolate synthase [Eubacteriales bacterium]
MNYEETLCKIHSFQKFGSRLGLERMTVLMRLLGDPQDKMKVIHVAGTNGKGSVCRYLATILKENGYNVGLYTSPYLERFTERIEYNEEEITPRDLVICAEEVFEKIEEMVALGYESPTEFELVTAIGFVYFSRSPIDFLILEVGLGGIGDSTNVIKDPLVSIITSISHDHMDVLGNTLPEIAYEKAGIIKNGKPVVSNVKDTKAAQVIRRVALERGCAFYDVSQVVVRTIDKSFDGYSFIYEDKRYKLGMIGMHQIENAVCALKVIEILEKGEIITTEEEKNKRAMRRARQKGRLEILSKNPYIIIDGAHNEAGVEALSRVIREHFKGQRILLVVGMLSDKRVDRLIARFGEIPGDMLVTEPDNSRRLAADVLCKRVKETGRDCICIKDWESVCNFVEQIGLEYDVILFSGSIYLIGKIRGRFRNEKEQGFAYL